VSACPVLQGAQPWTLGWEPHTRTHTYDTAAQQMERARTDMHIGRGHSSLGVQHQPVGEEDAAACRQDNGEGSSVTQRVLHQVFVRTDHD
jgi:hypothetical protein